MPIWFIIIRSILDIIIVIIVLIFMIVVVLWIINNALELRDVSKKLDRIENALNIKPNNEKI